MEVEVVMPSQPTDFNFDSACTSPYITAPSSPQRFGTFFYSAPTSPTRVSALYHDSAATGTAGGDTTNEDDDDDDYTDFAFNFSGQLEKSPLSADELFDGGKIKPLKPSPTLQCEKKPPDSPKKSPPRLRKNEYDPFATSLEQTGKESIQETTRRTKSLSPFKVSDLLFDGSDNGQEACKNSSSTSSCWYKKWKIKDLLLFRSASESRATELKKYEMLKKNSHPQVEHELPAMIKNYSIRSMDSVGSGSSRRRSGPLVSAHELHYTANRAASEEMKKRTFLPYKQGLLGCLGFNPTASLSR